MNEINVIKAPVEYTPEQAGYIPEILDKIDDHLKGLITGNTIFAAAYLLSRGDRVFAHRSFGRLRFDDENSQYKPDTIRGIWSITKVFTATAIVKLIEDGMIHLHQPVREIIKEFDNNMFGKITIFHLLTHSGGIHPDPCVMFEPYPRKWDWHEREDWIMEILKDTIHHEPGTEWRYCSAGFSILAEIVKRVTGIQYEKYVMDRIINPLGLDDTYFDLPSEKEDRLCFTKQQELDDFLKHKKQKRPSWAPPRGSSGLFSTLNDLRKFGQMLINKGTYRGKRILSRKAAEAMLREQFRGIDHTWVTSGGIMEYGLGLNVYSNNTFLSPGSFSHEGAGISGLYMDPVEDFVFAYFCPLAGDAGWEIKAVVHFRNIVWSGIV